MTGVPDMRDRLIVALDLASVAEAEKAVTEIGDACRFYKIGFELALSGGLELARDLSRDGLSVFLDMKLLDIGHTVEKAVESALRMGVAMLTIHAYPQTMAAAVSAARGSDLLLLAVTVLTSMDDGDLAEAGYGMGVGELVARRAAQAREAGMGGVVCSATEAALLRRTVGAGMALVTPGIRPAGSAVDDQKRVMAPGAALRAGASHLVVGRPVLRAVDRRAAAWAILDDMASA